MAVTALWPYGGPGIPYGSFSGKAPAPPVEESAETYTGGWPSYGYRRKRRKPVVEEVSERIDQQVEALISLQEQIDRERQEIALLEAKARQNKAERLYAQNLRAAIAKDMAVIEEMGRIRDELLTLRYLEEVEDAKRRQRNLQIIIMMEA